MIFIRYPFPCDLKVLNFETLFVNVDQIKDDIGSYLGCDEFSLFYNERKLHNSEVIPNNATVHVTFPLPGGKGGFGSMLRAIGAQIEKTTNREACRDLSGRRLRDINEEQRLKKWIAKEAEREAEKVRRRQARIERLKTKAPHKFFDINYEKEISELPERIDEALNEGLQKVKQPKKRPLENSGETSLPKKSWLLDDIPITSSDSDSDETNAMSEAGPSKKMKASKESSSYYDSNTSESSQSYPDSSKDSIPEESTSNDSKSAFRMEENSTDSDKMDVAQCGEGFTEDLSTVQAPGTKNADTERETKTKSAIATVMDKDVKTKSIPEESNCAISRESEETHTENNEVAAVNESVGKKVAVEESGCTAVKKLEAKDDSPVDLQDFQSISELEALGLDRLKSALMIRGLKCGGTLSDRAQRLWKVRDLQPHQYPTSLLAKNKK